MIACTVMKIVPPIALSHQKNSMVKKRNASVSMPRNPIYKYIVVEKIFVLAIYTFVLGFVKNLAWNTKIPEPPYCYCVVDVIIESD